MTSLKQVVGWILSNCRRGRTLQRQALWQQLGTEATVLAGMRPLPRMSHMTLRMIPGGCGRVRSIPIQRPSRHDLTLWTWTRMRRKCCRKPGPALQTPGEGVSTVPSLHHRMGMHVCLCSSIASCCLLQGQEGQTQGQGEAAGGGAAAGVAAEEARAQGGWHRHAGRQAQRPGDRLQPGGRI